MRFDPSLVAYLAMAGLLMVLVAAQFGPDQGGSGASRATAGHKLPQIGAGSWFAARHKAPEQLAGCKADYVYDGDTVELLCAGKRFRARLVGFDAPETHPAHCPAEATLGVRATDELRRLAGRADDDYSDRGHDQYGRELVSMRVGGKDVAGVMIAQGLAVSYDGAARIDWCARLEHVRR